MAARRGFTLLEAAVAMVIIAIVAISALGAFGADLRAATRAQQLLPAAALARERLAVLELVNAQTLHMLPDSMTHGDFAAPYSQYHWRATATEMRTEPGLIELTVAIAWPEGAFSLVERRYRPLPRTAVSGGSRGGP